VKGQCRKSDDCGPKTTGMKKMQTSASSSETRNGKRKKTCSVKISPMVENAYKGYSFLPEERGDDLVTSFMKL